MGRLTKLSSGIARLRPALARASVEGREDARQRDLDAPWRRWYRTARWRRLRIVVFTRDLFTCRICGRIADAGHLVCDHKAAHRGNERLFWDEVNLQTLCKGCHDGVKQSEEQRSLTERGIWY